MKLHHIIICVLITALCTQWYCSYKHTKDNEAIAKQNQLSIERMECESIRNGILTRRIPARMVGWGYIEGMCPQGGLYKLTTSDGMHQRLYCSVHGE